MQIYNLKVDEATHKAKASIDYHVRKGDQEVWSATETTEQMKQNGEQITIERLFPLAALGPGHYKLQINATDHLANQSISRSTEFTVKPASEIKAAANTTPGR